jgi:putative ABC transport system permease protein
VIFLLALRNLITQLKHTLIIVSLITLIITLFFIGNTIIGTATEGLRTTYILNYTGDVIVQATSDTSMSLFGANTPAIDDFFSIPVLKGYAAIRTLLNEADGVEAVTPQISGPVAIDVGGHRYGSFAFGIEAETYFSVFPGITLRAGNFLRPGERGAMITWERAQKIEADIGRPVTPGDRLLFTTASETGFKIREVPLVGLYSYTNSGQIPNEITLLDAQTARALNSILLAHQPDQAAPAQTTDILTDDVDALFTDTAPAPSATADSVSLAELQAAVQEHPAESFAPWSEGGWNFFIVRLKPGTAAGPFIDRLNGILAPFSASAVDWSTAAGLPALLVTLLFYLFNGGLVLIIVAGVIAIVNILLISVFQRVKEIGTLRAIGASNTAIRIMFYTENLTVSFLAGALGILMGTAAISIVNTLRLFVSNSLLVSMLGHHTLSFPFLPAVASASLLLALLLGLISSFYPVRLALKIQPIEALTKG